MEKLGKDLKLLVEEYASTLKVQGKWNENKSASLSTNVEMHVYEAVFKKLTEKCVL